MSALGEHDRRLSTLSMMGVVLETDLAEARARVDADGLVTDWIPWVERRAGAGARTWHAPAVGEQVIILCPYGDPSQAVIVGSIYQEAHPAPADADTVDRTVYSDGSVVEYDSESTTLTVHVGSGKVIVHCATAEVHASESVTLDTPTTRATGDLKVDGKIEAGKDITTPAEVKAGDIGLKAHKHTAQGATAPTTPAQP